MKKFAFFGAVLLLASCTGNQPKNQYTLNGTIQGVDGQEIYIAYQLNDTTHFMDTTTIHNGAFAFKGKLTKPAVRATVWMGDIQNRFNQKLASVYIEPTTMTMDIDTACFERPTFTGSVSQTEAETFTKAILALDPMSPDHHQKLDQLYHDFTFNNPNSFVAADNMNLLMSRMSFDELKSAYEKFSPRVKESGALANVEKEIATLQRIQPGQLAPDFETKDINGNLIRFSEVVKGKYVILDFWASWCAPCRQSFPHVKELYDKYKSKGLVVFCVGDNDNSEDKWREAIEKDGIQNFIHVLRGLKNVGNGFDRTNDISDKYAVHFLPTKFLIDKDFKIVGKMGDDELDAKLKEIFGE